MGENLVCFIFEEVKWLYGFVNNRTMSAAKPYNHLINSF